MFEIPKRVSLSSHAAATIRSGIAEGTWEEFLPSERRLCEMLNVSRPTIRTALHLLADEGLIDIRQGRRNRLLVQPKRARNQRNPLVGIITHEPVSQMALTAYRGISEMRAHLAKHGFRTEVYVIQPGTAPAQCRKLEAFVRQNRVFCCLLHSVSQEIQQWFAEQAVPALVLGSCHAKMPLPSLDVDYRSVCRHAAGVFLGKGHRRVALIVPHSGVAGDLASEQGFKEGMQAGVGLEEARAAIVRHNGTAKNIVARLDALFKTKPAPTALLVAKPAFVFTVMIYLLKSGLAVPTNVSLISRDPDNLFEAVDPLIAHYRFTTDVHAHRLSRLMIRLVSHGTLPKEPSLIFPRFFAGRTVATRTP